jgi:hypothetical protein
MISIQCHITLHIIHASMSPKVGADVAPAGNIMFAMRNQIHAHEVTEALAILGIVRTHMRKRTAVPRPRRS